MKDVDVVVHLAAIVGYPACKREPRLAQEVNSTAPGCSIACARRTRRSSLPPPGATTARWSGSVCTEETPLNPLSEYGVTKTAAERHLLDAGNVVCYRFATAFGVSTRMRLDLLVNDFVYQAGSTTDLILYERTFKRTFVHVRDIARAFAFAVDNWAGMRDDVYNVGSER